MTSAEHQKWLDTGLGWHLARPLVALRDVLRRRGYLVYDIGNQGHMDHMPPEDHTPFSKTGWPIATPYGWVTAIDVMPDGIVEEGLPPLAELGQRLWADRQAGKLLWLKYMNWSPFGPSTAVHDSWQPTYARRSSTDVGHIHISCRSDMVQQDFGPYDPFASDMEAPMLILGDGDARYAVGPNGPVLLTWAQWVKSGFDKEPPPVLQLDSKGQLDQFRPAKYTDDTALAAALAANPDAMQAIATLLGNAVVHTLAEAIADAFARLGSTN